MSRLIIVSNRLPFTLKQHEGRIESSPSSGGLVTALVSYLQHQRQRDPSFESLWVGWPGSELSTELHPSAREALAKEHAHPVFLSREDGDEFYYGFCNRTLWPLFHYFTSYVDYDPEYWDTYVRVNRAFCDAVSELVRPGDTIWVHDYHLLLLPKLLRAAHPEATIGFFLHTPFPSFEVFRLLPGPWKQQLLEGLLGADLVGFHVHEYTQHFLHCVHRILGHDHHLGKIALGQQVRRADTFSLGVDFEKFTRTAQAPAVVKRSREIGAGLRDVKVLLSVDRLDYTKGIANRLAGYELFLEQHPEWHGKVSFVLLVVPSRVEVPRYEQLKVELDKRVGEINGRFGKLDWAPIVYQFNSVDFEELVALYRLADVALITPLRDGMNLVAKEYLASKPDASGVLILSELAGAAREMNEALLINPQHLGEIADAIAQALEMPREEQIRHNEPIRARLAKHDANQWAQQFLAALARVKEQQGKLATKALGPRLQAELREGLRAARRALVLLDYDGTLTPIVARPELAAPDEELLQLLGALARDPRLSSFVISGRERGSLERWLSPTGVGLIAEHGAWIRDPGSDWRLLRPISTEWKEQVAALLRVFVSQVAGSMLEEKDYALAWHYRGVDPDLGAQRAKELIDELTLFTANLDVQVLEGKKVVEVRSAGVHKGAAAAELIARFDPDFILAVGDDRTDEDVFRMLPPSAASIHVGSPMSSARYCVKSPRDVRELLHALLEPR